ncbi:MAG: hypothetical protein ABI688_10810, partial [Bacteroidota bacterium]
MSYQYTTFVPAGKIFPAGNEWFENQLHSYNFGISMQEEKLIMFRNRLTKVFRHLRKQARRLGVSCYRVYDHDLPEFPFCIEFYGDKLYVAEYKRFHGLTEEEHDEWIEQSVLVMTEVLAVEKENIFIKLRRRKPGRHGQYQKYDAVPVDPAATE